MSRCPPGLRVTAPSSSNGRGGAEPRRARALALARAPAPPPLRLSARRRRRREAAPRALLEARVLPLRRAQGEAPRRPLPRRRPLPLRRRSPGEGYNVESGVGEALPIRDPRARQIAPRWNRGSTSQVITASWCGAHSEENICCIRSVEDLFPASYFAFKWINFEP